MSATATTAPKLTTVSEPYGYHSTPFSGEYCYTTTRTIELVDYGYATGPMVYTREVVRVCPADQLGAGTYDHSLQRPATVEEVTALLLSVTAPRVVSCCPGCTCGGNSERPCGACQHNHH